MRRIYFYLFVFILTAVGCDKAQTDEVYISDEAYISDVAYMSDELNINITSDKIWAHRFDSLKYINERLHEFYGIEIDIFYNKAYNRFEVKHDLNLRGLIWSCF